MRKPRRNPLTRRSAARALDGAATSGSAGLDQVLAAVTAPATPSELSREDAALLIFQQGRQAPAHRAEPAGLRTRIATARVAAAGLVLALLAGGGVAIAAGIGPIDGLFETPRNEPVKPVTSGAPEIPATPSSKPGSTATATPVQSYVGLCRAFQADAATNDNARSDPAFAALAKDAGGQSQIADYCDDLLGDPTATPTGRPAELPTQAADPGRPAIPTPSARPTQPTIPTPTAKPTQPTVPPPPTQPTDPTPPVEPDPPGGGKPTKAPRP